MIIGKSRIGIGRIGMVTASFEEPSILANITILGTESPYVYANMSIVDVYPLSVLANMDIDAYNHREVLSNMSILGRIPVPISANMNISDRVVKGVLSNMSILAVQYLQVAAAISIIGQVTRSVRANMSILESIDRSAQANMSIADLIEQCASVAMSISGALDIEARANFTISDLRASTTTVSMDIVDNHYWAIGPEGGVLDLSGKVADPKPDGFGIEASKTGMLEGRRVNLRDKGIKGGEYTFYVYLDNDSDRQAFQKVVNNDAKDYVLHIGRSDRFYYIKKMATNPEKIKVARGPVQRVTCWMEDPCMYHYWDQGGDLGICALPHDSTYKFNYGTAPTPILFKIGGFYSGGQLTSPYVSVWDGSEESRLYIGPGLLSNEWAELTLDGWHKKYLKHTYSDDYSTNNSWQYDAVQSGCSLSGGQVSVPSGGWFYYKFQGHPLKENIRLLATITKAGSPMIQYSTDGTTWTTSIAASEIVSGQHTEYYLTGTEKISSVYVRFYSPVGSSMTVQDVSFSMDRDISAQYDQLPTCPAQEPRKLRFEGSGSARARLQTTFRSRWYAQ